MSKSPRKRGRPVTVDKDAALHALVELFRAKGFAAASLDDLSAATGLSRPSLYRAFGDKLSMYLAAMDAFGAEVAHKAAPELFAHDSIETALNAFYAAMIDLYYRDADMAAGCLIFGTAPSSADEAAIQARLQIGVGALDDLMRSRIKQASPKATAAQVDAAVQVASNTLIAFSARAKSGALKEELAGMGAHAADIVSELVR